MSLFTVGTLFAATAPGFELLLTGRIVQASGTALMLPLLMNTVLNLVPAHRRGRMMGVISIVIAVAPAIGPTISGIILQALDWRWMFWLVLPIALVAFAVGFRLVKNVTPTSNPSFDAASVVLSALAFGGLVYGLSSIGHSAEGSSVPVWIPLVVGAVALADVRAKADCAPRLRPRPAEPAPVLDADVQHRTRHAHDFHDGPVRGAYPAAALPPEHPRPSTL